MDRKSPGIHLINLLSYPQKFTLIGFLFAIPLTLVMYLLISEINSRVDFAEKEIYANQYLRPLRQLREYIPKLQLLNYQSLNPNLSNSESRANLEAKIDANFQSLANTEPQLGNILMSSENLNKFNQNWQNLKLRRSQWSLETYDFVYQRLAADINRLSARVGDTSHLILDPDLDIYYLINATLLNLPKMQKILSEIRLISQKISLRSDATGLDAEIAEFVAETSVQLYSGDVVVLYTDGITEAENMDKLLYGLERLIEVIEINGQHSAAEIRDAVIKDVRSHIDKQKVFDDITLLVLKQK